MKRAVGMACAALFAACVLVGCVKSGGKSSGSDEAKGEMTMKTLKRLGKVRELSEKKDFEGALTELDEIAQGEYLNPYEKAKLWEARAGVHLAMEKYDEVPEDLSKALAEDALSKKERVAVRFNLGQALFMNERFGESADALAAWAEEAEDPKPEQQFVIASAFSQAKRFKDALPYAEKAVEGSEQPAEAWLLLVASLHYELKQNEPLAAALVRLTQLYPKKEHYLQLSATYTEMDDSVKALKALEAADAKGLLSEGKEYTALAQLYLEVGQAKKGAALLDKHMKAGKIERSTETLGLLALCFIGAKDADRAAATLEAAGDAIDAGQPYLELARLQAARGEWEKARDAAAQSVIKGGLDTPGEGHLVLGAAHYKTKRKDAALNSLKEAKKHPAVAPCANELMRVVNAGKGEPPACVAKPIPSR